MVIKPYSKNAKKHPKDQLAKIAASIQRFGFRQPVVVDGDGTIIVGHGRYEAARKVLGWRKEAMAPFSAKGDETIPYVLADDLTPEEIAAYRLADNKLNESEWDMELVGAELEALPEDLKLLTGFEDVLKIATQEDDFDATPPKEPRTKLGDLYVLGDHRLLCGDATDPTAAQRLCGDDLADMMVTDPPYNVSYEGKTKDALTIQNDTMEDQPFRAFLAASFQAADSVMREGGAFYVWHADLEGFNFRGACKDAGWTVRQCLVWKKNCMVMGRQDYQWRHEPCLYGWKDGAAHTWESDRKQTTILEFDKPQRNVEHPTMKPVALFSYLILNSSKAGAVVLDTFAGSGTAMIACEQAGRRCFSLELDEKYCDVIISRWCELTGRYDITKNGEPCRWEPKAADVS